MPISFYFSSLIAIAATIMVITRYHPIHALLYLVVSFMAVAIIFLSIGAPFIAALEIIVYAGAIIVLFIFVVMMLNLGKDTAQQEREWLKPKVWAAPVLLAIILAVQFITLLTEGAPEAMRVPAVDIKKVSISLYGEYILGLELAGFLLTAGIVGAAHIGKHKKRHLHRFLQDNEDQNSGVPEQFMHPAGNSKKMESNIEHH